MLYPCGSLFHFYYNLLVEDMTFATPPPAKTSWVATSTPHWPGHGSHPPADAIDDDAGSVFSPETRDGGNWLQIDIGEARVVSGLTVEVRNGVQERFSSVEMRVGLVSMPNTDLQVCTRCISERIGKVSSVKDHGKFMFVRCQLK